MKEKQIEWLLWKCAVVGSEIEGERGRKEGKKEMVTDAKPDIFLPHTSFKNGGKTMRIKMPLWKPEFGR
jgi:hypothetical protein